MKPNDLDELAALFRRVNAGGPGQTTATMLFERKAASLGFDSFALFNTMRQGGSLALYEPPKPPATQTSTDKPGTSGWPDTIRIRLWCARVERSALATFKKVPGDVFAFRQIEREAVQTGSGDAEAVNADFPSGLLRWNSAACPHCGGACETEKSGPVLCVNCDKLRCPSGVHTRKGRDAWRCVCGADAYFEGEPVEARLSLANAAIPAAGAARSGQPVLGYTSDLPRLEAPRRGL